ncbi:MAG: SEC-C metal-binding domain-containing protein [Candidatus Nitrosocosmicus sp.]
MVLTDLKDSSSIDFIKSLFEDGEIDEEITTLDEVLDVYKELYDKNIEESYRMKDILDYFKVNDFFLSSNSDLSEGHTFLNDDLGSVPIESDIKGDHVQVSNHPTTKTLKPKIGRNDLCHCGSGKKYKKCCMNKPAP